jgi:hypothetical protein
VILAADLLICHQKTEIITVLCFSQRIPEAGVGKTRTATARRKNWQYVSALFHLKL